MKTLYTILLVEQGRTLRFDEVFKATKGKKLGGYPATFASEQRADEVLDEFAYEYLERGEDPPIMEVVDHAYN